MSFSFCATKMKTWLVLSCGFFGMACAPAPQEIVLPIAERPGVLLLATDPPGAQVRIDGIPSAVSSLQPGEFISIDLPRGQRVIELNLEIDEFSLWHAREEIEVGDSALPARLITLSQILTEVGEQKRAEQLRVIEGRKQLAIDRFQDSGLGLVVDTASGLMWMRCSVGQTWSDGKCIGEPRMLGWYEAQTAVDRIVFGGFDDWRLPARDELLSLVFCSSGMRFDYDLDGAGGACAGDFTQPTILLEVFPDTPPGKYWTSTPSTMSFAAWGVAFTIGVTGVGNKNDPVFMRPVRDVGLRSLPDEPPPRSSPLE